MIEKSKKVFIEMIQESTWLHEKTKKAAILKVQKMTKMVGYPEEFEKTGALDTLFENLVILESDTYSILLKKIQRFKVELALENVASELGMELGGRLYAANAFYQPSINQLRVLAPFMDDPIFDSTYPEYVQIATLGKIINHEIGHGFDPNHRGKDENGEEKDLWQPEDLVEYEKRVKCLIEQYNEYDDPDFGKKLNGSVVISELVADGFGMDVAWKTFKKLGLASQAKLIGFKDYPIDKLFFQTVAVNLCNQRSKKDVDFAVQFDTHPTDSFRVNGVFSNMKAFAETFNCPVGSPMNPKKKCDLF
ncbi:hypothetical protein GCK72_006922 [Caenorhabditis remanei]|uniref:Peptidase M13 C-terminal domain-containing protein n=1 Tax=Caenorhabditis remanei TaxID=31234 RepID=A0A6A5HK42_CAERE|nr:hypothetical protein GCK72_006922 [Caenorhabditis remanei]KAF1766964.1 hypothetical protein GCK72_006922 [Caenorhabditis remanei]